MSGSLIHLLHSLGHPHVLVLGDLMVDRYVWGDVRRISPEAPVPVLRAERTEYRLGGAASVAALLVSLGARVTLAGVIGADAAGQQFRRLLEGLDIDAELVLIDAERPTTLKERYLGRALHKYPQQILRVDYESDRAISPVLAEQIGGGCLSRLEDAAIVLVSDYGKGVCTTEILAQLIPAAHRQKLRVLVDPSPATSDWERYRGANLLTPNRSEAAQTLGQPIPDLTAGYVAAELLQRRFGLEVGLVKLDRQGIVMATADGRRCHYPALERQVYDITGAGDTVLATLGLVLAEGHGLEEAVQLATVAAGMQVERVGVCPITRQELLAELTAQLPRGREKLLPLDVLLAELQSARRKRQRIAFTNGCFDLLHPGHIHLLSEARQQADLLVVGLNSDASVRRLKGPSRPIQDQACRVEVLGALACVDYICLFNEDTPEALVQAVRPDVMVKGADYRPEQIAGWEFVKAQGGRLHLVALVDGQSTTALAARLQGTVAAGPG